MAAKSPKEMAKEVAMKKIIELKNKGKGVDDKKGGEPEIKPYAGGKEKTPTGKENKFVGDFGKFMETAKQRGLDVSKIKSAEDLQGQLYDKLMESEKGKNVLKTMWKDYGVTKKGGGGVAEEPMSDDTLAKLKRAFMDAKLGGRTRQLLEKTPEKPTPEKPKEEPKPKRRHVAEIVEGVNTKGKEGVSKGIGYVYKHKDLEFDPKYGERVVPNSEYKEVVIHPEDSEYYKTTMKNSSENIEDVIKRYSEKHGTKNVSRGTSSKNNYKPEYLEQFKRQNIK